MSEEIKFVPYAVAKKIVGEIVDEEHLHESDRRIMTVYDVDGRELCWFDTAEIMADLGITKTDTDQAKGPEMYLFFTQQQQEHTR